jgi:hypothetical protein
MSRHARPTNGCCPLRRPLPSTAEAMGTALMRCADALAGCMEGSDEEAKLKAIVDLIEAYEGKCWPLGKDPDVPDGKG